MEQIPLPSPIHYELVLQLLERQTTFAVTGTPAMREKVQQLIVTMRKAAAQQKHLEESLQQAGLQVEIQTGKLQMCRYFQKQQMYAHSSACFLSRH